MKKLPKAKSADILLLLEGTYPYVSGGVSSWVYQLMCQFPQYTFAIIFLGSRPDDYGEIVYDFPENLVHLEEHYLFSSMEMAKPKKCKSKDSTKRSVKEFHEWLRCPHNIDAGDILDNLTKQLCETREVNEKQFLYSEEMWSVLEETYDENCPEIPFTDYYWHVRNMHMPLWKFVDIANNAPKVKVFHTISTGYAGFLGALLQRLYNRPLLLSEHGIYTKERRIDLLKHQTFSRKQSMLLPDATGPDYISSLWLRFFSSLGKICYLSAETIISLFDVSRSVQITGGAKDEKTMIIPNGIEAEKFVHLRQAIHDNQNPIVGLIGRVVPIKDIKTFIRSIRVAVEAQPEIQGWIIGPDDEDPEYANECKQLVKTMRLENNIVFTGHQNIMEILPKLKLVVLSSISEGLPLVLLEAFAAGIPAVTTRVGACSALIEGSHESSDDKGLGPAGRVVDIANPSVMANAILELLNDRKAWSEAHKAAIARVTKFYDQSNITKQYAELYEKSMEEITWPA